MVRKRRKYSEAEKIQILEMYKNGCAPKVISECIGCSGYTIRYIAKKNNVRLIPNGERAIGSAKHNAFSKQTPDSDYWAGFMMADGHITIGYGTPLISLTVGVRDREHIEKFKIFLGASSKITERPGYGYCGGFPGAKNTLRLSVRSEQLTDDLISYGVFPRKSGKEEVLKPVSKHFWRGAVDGDGYISDYLIIGLVGSKKFCTQFLEFGSKLGASGGLYKKRNCWEARFTNSKGRKMANYLYDNNCVALSRKKLRKLEVFDARF